MDGDATISELQIEEGIDMYQLPASARLADRGCAACKMRILSRGGGGGRGRVIVAEEWGLQWRRAKFRKTLSLSHSLYLLHQ